VAIIGKCYSQQLPCFITTHLNKSDVQVKRYTKHYMQCRMYCTLHDPHILRKVELCLFQKFIITADYFSKNGCFAYFAIYIYKNCQYIYIWVNIVNYCTVYSIRTIGFSLSPPHHIQWLCIGLESSPMTIYVPLWSETIQLWKWKCTKLTEAEFLDLIGTEEF